MSEPFAGAADLMQAWRDGRRPDPELTVSEWADAHRILSPRGANEAGPWRTSRTPYLREIMDALSPSHPAQRIVVMKGAQIGATEAGNNWIGYVIHHAPGPMLAVQPTVDLAKRFSQQRVAGLIEESAPVRERIAPSRARDSGNTVLSKEFPGGILVMTGANSAVGLRSMPARYLFLDEVDAYPQSADEEGEPVALAEARTRTFSWRRKVFMPSTPTIKGMSRVEREFEASDQRRFFLPCPHCGERQWLQFERLRWTWGKPETVASVCQGCDAPIHEAAKTGMLAAGEWRATAESTDPTTIGFHISSLYSPVGWLSWERIARDWEAAQSSDEAKRAFRNTVLGETWAESGEAPDWQRLYDRREPWRLGTVPAGALVLTAGADVQKDRLEVSVWAWARGFESWLVDHRVIEHGPDEPQAWADLDSLLEATWPRPDGLRVGVARLAIDAGFESPAVYAWARRQGSARAVAVKGVETFNSSMPVSARPTYVDATEGGRKIKRGAKLWTVAVSTLKSEFYRWLRHDPPTDEDQEAGVAYPAGYVHLPRGIDAEWCKQLVGEQLMSVKNRRGFVRLEWQKMRPRNEALDCRVYARAALYIVGADKYGPRFWDQVEAQAAPPAPVYRAPETEPRPAATTPTARPPAARSSDWIGDVNSDWI